MTYIAAILISALLTWFTKHKAVQRAYRLREQAWHERAVAVNENEMLKRQLAHLAKQLEALEFSNRLLAAALAAKTNLKT